MATGLTHGILDGDDFRTFLIGCARQFSPLGFMRDLAADAQIPDRVDVDTYHQDQAAELRTRLAQVQAMTDDEAQAESVADHAALMVHHLKLLEDAKAKLLKYNAMLGRVQAWTPPTPDHQPIKDFMVRQIMDSIAFDCEVAEWNKKIQPVPGPAWRQAQIAELTRQIEYHEKEQADQLMRAERRNLWIKQFKDALPEPGT